MVDKEITARHFLVLGLGATLPEVGSEMTILHFMCF